MGRANSRCLVYSFGVSDDWSFEDTMGNLGCRVRAFDPTIDSPEKRYGYSRTAVARHPTGLF